MRHLFRALLVVTLLVSLLVACSKNGLGDACDGEGSTDDCDDGLVCVKRAADTKIVCAKICSAKSDCSATEECTGTKGSLKACQADD